MSDDNDYPNALPFNTFDDCLTESPKDWLIEGVIALDEDSTWFGPPGALKSALLTEIAVHVASGRDWRGFKFNRFNDCESENLNIEENRGVVYFALERAKLTRRRLAAYASRDGLRGLPITIVDKPVNLLDPACVDIIADTINAVEAKGVSVGLVIFDTYSKTILGGQANDAEPHNLAGLHIAKIREKAGSHFHAAAIGHTGKNEAAGERNSNARLGHVDLAVQLAGDKIRTATIVKANDQAEQQLASFEMEDVLVTVPGQTMQTRTGPFVVDPQTYSVAILAAHTPATEARTIAPGSLSGKHMQALEALGRAITERGKDDAVHVNFWKEELTRGGLLDPKAKNPWQPFKRIKYALAKHIIEEGEFVRVVPPSLPSHI